jgi:hypothetical protein
MRGNPQRPGGTGEKETGTMDKTKTRRRRTIFKDPLTEVTLDEQGRKKQTFLKGEIAYREGGSNIFSGSREARGYEVTIHPITEEERDGYTMTGFMIFGPGLRKLLKEVKRFNAREFEEITVEPGELEALKAKVKADWEAEQGKRVES